MAREGRFEKTNPVCLNPLSLRALCAILSIGCFVFAAFAEDRPAPIPAGNPATLTAGKPAMPAVNQPVMFNTPEADAILAALQVFPPDNPWNEDISKLPVLKNSEAMIATIGPEKKLAYNLDMAFVLVPGDQQRVEAKILSYPGESDKGPYPIPDNAPVEGWPLDGRTLAAAQSARARRPARDRGGPGEPDAL